MIEALVGHLWGSTLFSLAAACATLAFRNNGAHVRFWLWFAASMKFLLPFSLLAAVGRYVGPHSIAATTPAPVKVVIEALSMPTMRSIVHSSAGEASPMDLTLLLAVAWVIGFLIVISHWT